MLPRTNRLPTDKLSALKKNKNLVSSKYIKLLFAKNSLDSFRAGVIVSKSVSKKAVVRNRLKRAVMKAFAESKEKLNGLDLLVIVKIGADKAGQRDFEKDITDLFHKDLKTDSQYH